MAFDGADDDGRVGTEDVVADQLRGGAQAGSERDPAVLVVLTQAVLDRVHRELPGDGREAVDHVTAGQQVTGHLVAAVRLAELRGGQVQRDGHAVAARLVAGVGDGLHQQPQDLFRLGDLRGEAALVAQPGGQLAAGKLAAQRAVDLGARPDGVGHRRRAHRGDHEFLEVQRVGRVHAAVEHVEVRDRQRRRDTFRGKPLPKGYSGRGGQRAGERHRGSHGGVGAEPALVRGAVQVDHGLVRLGQRGPSPAAQQVADFGVDGRYRSEDSFALVPVRVAVAAFHRLPRARRGAGWDPGPGGRVVRQPNGYRERGPSARVQDLQRGQIRDVESRHLVSPVWRRLGSAAARPVVSPGADHLAVETAAVVTYGPVRRQAGPSFLMRSLRLPPYDQRASTGGSRAARRPGLSPRLGSRTGRGRPWA